MNTKAEAVALTEANLDYLRETFTATKNHSEWLEQRLEESRENGELFYITKHEDRNFFKKVVGIGFATVPADFAERYAKHFDIVDRYSIAA